MIKYIIFIIFLTISSSSIAEDKKFFNQRYRGWLWFEDSAKPKKVSKVNPLPTPQEAATAIAVRKEELDNARNVMLESAYRPEISKRDFIGAVENYRRLEQQMQFMAMRVGSAWDESNLLNPDFLDELNHPSNMYGRKLKAELDAKNDELLLKQLAKKTELFVFRNKDCDYCGSLEKHLHAFAIKYGFNVEAVSEDDSSSEYFKTTKSAELIKKLGVKFMPTVFLVADGDVHRYEIARGLVSIEGLMRNCLQAAKLLKYGISK